MVNTLTNSFSWRINQTEDFYTMLRFSIFFAFIFTSVFAHAQEVLLPIQQTQPITSFHKKSEIAVLNLPFFDDFSYSTSAPDASKWTDQYVFVNNGFATNLKTVGVATFDCMASNGLLYDHLDYYNTYAADMLTSAYINLEGASSVYLSFLFQGGGNGLAPDKNDSLVVQFYSHPEEKWITVWKALGQQHTEFQEAYIPVNLKKYLNGNFRFRFINYVTIGKADKPSLRGNTDFWHIDQVYLNKNRAEGVLGLDDIAFFSKGKSMLKGYESMPWEHFTYNPTQLMANEFVANIWNHSSTSKNINELNFIIDDVWGTTPDVTIKAGSYDLSAQTIFSQNFTNSNFVFQSDKVDSAYFQVKTEMLLDKTDFWAANNTVIYDQFFKDYYAYDDGSAEVGYGISGNGSSNAQVAYLYENAKPGDELWGVDVYFTRTLNAANLNYFLLTVWEDEDGEPGEILYQQPLAENLSYTKGYNVFSAFRLHEAEGQNDTSVVVPKSFFIGWEQTVEGHLGIGLDKNTNASSKLFYNVSDTWKNTSIEGALMFRPVFSKRKKTTTSISKPTAQLLQIFPNPARDYVQFQLPNNLLNVKYSIYNLQGSKVKEGIYNNANLNISTLPKGIYIVRATSKSENFVGKLVIN